MLKNCPECGRAVSEYAPICPNCGLPMSMFEKASKVVKTYPSNGVDLGLPSGTIWSSCNVGAKSAYDVGLYFAWGDLQIKDKYTWENYRYFLGYIKDDFHTLPRLSKYVSHSRLGIVDDKSYLEPSDDPATQFMGQQWCTPSHEQSDEIWRYCKISKVEEKGISGYRVIGPNGNSLFFANSGYLRGDKKLSPESPYLWLNRANFCGWENATCFLFVKNYGGNIATTSPDRFCGLPIRPVLKT